MLENRLTEKELEELSKFRLTAEKSEGELTFCAADLIKSTTLQPMLKMLKSRIEAPNILVTSSILMKRYAFLPVIYLYALTKWDKKLNFSLDDVHFEDHSKNGMWLPNIRLESLTYTQCTDHDRETFRREAFRFLFKDHLYRIISALYKETKVSKMVLWENIAVYLFWMYETLLETEADPLVRNNAASDFRYIFSEADGSVFGPLKRNPLSSFDTEKVKKEEDDQLIRIRKTCCYTYMLLKDKESAFCKTCPVGCRLRQKQKEEAMK